MEDPFPHFDDLPESQLILELTNLAESALAGDDEDAATLILLFRHRGLHDECHIKDCDAPWPCQHVSLDAKNVYPDAAQWVMLRYLYPEKYLAPDDPLWLKIDPKKYHEEPTGPTSDFSVLNPAAMVAGEPIFSPAHDMCQINPNIVPTLRQEKADRDLRRGRNGAVVNRSLKPLKFRSQENPHEKEK
jgi:hypothetical protein